MPRNGAGVYNLVNNTWYPPVNGVLAQSTDWQTFIDDVASALTQSVSKDGQTPMTGNLPMGGNKITGLATGTANTDAVNVSQISSNFGQCRLVKSGANIILQPFQGNRLTINGVVYSIPAAGVSLAPTGLIAATLYYIYAYMNAGTMTLESSTTGHSTDATTGVEIKTGDPSRSLVGMVYCQVGATFIDTPAYRGVATFFNRRLVAGFGASGPAGPGTIASWTELGSSAARVTFLTWGDYAVKSIGSCQTQVSAGGNILFFSIAFDSVTTPPGIAIGQFQGYATNAIGSVQSSYQAVLAEGLHYSATLGQSQVGSVTWNVFSQIVDIWI